MRCCAKTCRAIGESGPHPLCNRDFREERLFFGEVLVVSAAKRVSLTVSLSESLKVSLLSALQAMFLCGAISEQHTIQGQFVCERDGNYRAGLIKNRHLSRFAIKGQ